MVINRKKCIAKELGCHLQSSLLPANIPYTFLVSAPLSLVLRVTSMCPEKQQVARVLESLHPCV